MGWRGILRCTVYMVWDFKLKIFKGGSLIGGIALKVVKKEKERGPSGDA